MKLTAERPFANPEAAARKLIELAAAIEPTMPGRVYIELINYPMLFKLKASAENTRPASTSPLNAAGSSRTSPAPMSGF